MEDGTAWLGKIRERPWECANNGRKSCCPLHFPSNNVRRTRTTSIVPNEMKFLAVHPSLFDALEDLSSAGAARARACGSSSGTRRVLGQVDRSAMRIAPGFFPL